MEFTEKENKEFTEKENNNKLSHSINHKKAPYMNFLCENFKCIYINLRESKNQQKLIKIFL